jgi:hypothetical protein
MRQEPLTGEDDNLPLNVGHYLGDLGLERGQNVISLFIDLSLKFAPHEIVQRVMIW